MNNRGRRRKSYNSENSLHGVSQTQFIEQYKKSRTEEKTHTPTAMLKQIFIKLSQSEYELNWKLNMSICIKCFNTYVRLSASVLPFASIAVIHCGFSVWQSSQGAQTNINQISSIQPRWGGKIVENYKYSRSSSQRRSLGHNNLCN